MKQARKTTSLYEKMLPYIYDGVGVVNRWWPRLNWQTSKMVMCYHSVANSGWRFSTPVRDFERQVDYLQQRFEIVGLSKLLESKQDGLVSLTFDDGYEDVYKNALPILQQRGLVATVFVTGGETKVDRNELDNDLPLMNLKQVKKLHSQGWEVGFHTSGHKDMRKLGISKLRKEIVIGKAELEKKLGFELKYFAYPRGFYSDQVVKLVEQAGFETAFTVDNKVAGSDNKFLVGRVSMEGRLNLKHFRVCVSRVGIKVNEILFGLLKTKEAWLNQLAKV